MILMTIEHSVKFCREGKYLTQWEVARECKTDSQFVFSRPQLLFHIVNLSLSATLKAIKPSDQFQT